MGERIMQTNINGATQAQKLAAGARILADLTGSKATSTDSETVAAIKDIIALYDVKTADFVQAVFAEAARNVVDGEFDRTKSITSPKALVAKWQQHLPLRQLLPTCKVIAKDFPLKVAKPKATKPAAAKTDKPAKVTTPKVKAARDSGHRQS
jgi:hypothetical protein